MTIIEPSKNQYQISLGIFLVILALAMLTVSSIYFYNQNVNLRYALTENTKKLQEAKESNADYKNQFYQILDAKNVASLIKNRNLVQEKNPAYLETQPALASN